MENNKTTYKILYGIPAMLLPNNQELKKYLNGYGHVVDYTYDDENFDLWCDFEIMCRIDEENKSVYTILFETCLGFKGEDGCKNWIKSCLEYFTDYMVSHGYNTSKELSMYEVLTEGVNVNTEFEDIETMYAFMKFVVNGFNGYGMEILWGDK